MKIDLGCGPNKKDGFIGCDRIAFAGVDHVFDIGTARWPFDDGSVEEAHASHFVEHLTPVERCHFVNELFRVMKPGATCALITPYWKSNRAYGDPTHQWPPVSEMWFYYLGREWRMANAPHTDKQYWPAGFDCDFDATWSYALHPMMGARNREFQDFALNFYTEAAQDLHATLKRR